MVSFLGTYMPYILRGFYFHEFRKSGAIRKFNNTRKYFLRSRRINATCVRNTSSTVCQYTVHVQDR